MNKKVPFTSLQKMMEIITVAALITLFVYLIIIWNDLPERIPSHYDFSGNANAWSSKGTIIALPLVALALYALMTAVSFFPSLWNTPVRITEKNYMFVYQSIRTLVGLIKLVLVVTFSYITYSMANAQPLDQSYIIVFLCATFIPIIWAIVRIVRGNKKINEGSE